MYYTSFGHVVAEAGNWVLLDLVFLRCFDSIVIGPSLEPIKAQNKQLMSEILSTFQNHSQRQNANPILVLTT